MIKVSPEPAEALVRQAPCWFMAEFFILGAQRRKGLGQQALAHLLARHPGVWEIAVMDLNGDAIRFWDRVLSDMDVAERVTRARRHDGRAWTIHSFTADRP